MHRNIQNKKILVVSGHSESLLRFRGHIISKLLECNYKVFATAPLSSQDLDYLRPLINKGLIVKNTPLNRTGLNILGDALYFFRIFFFVIRIKPDYLFTYNIKPVIYSGIVAWLLRVPHKFALITGLGFAFTDDDNNKRLIQRLVAFLYHHSLKRMEKIFFQNSDDKNLFCSLNITSDERSLVVHGSGVDTDFYNVRPLPKSINFLLIARLVNNKGVREYIEAARIVRGFNPEVQFSLVGWSDKNIDSIKPGELSNWINDDGINFYGHLDDVRSALEKCSVYVLPSYREGTPRSTLEAMSMGRPIITTDTPGCRETVIDGENGFLVPVKSVNDLAQAMMKFVDCPALIPKMGECSRQIAVNKYDVLKVNKYMLFEMKLCEK